MHTYAIILAAGSGTRLANATDGIKKQFLLYKNAPLFWNSAITFSRVARIRGLIFVLPEEDLEAGKQQLKELDRFRSLGLPWVATVGGKRRQDSVYNGLAALPKECDTVLIHDGARPFMTPALVNNLLDTLAQDATSAIPVLPVTDTIKIVDGDTISHTPDRSSLRAVQTPQGFVRSILQQAHEQSRTENWNVTDDASLLEQAGMPVTIVDGEAGNIKITNSEDLAMLKTDNAPQMIPCVGWGYDVHRYATPKDKKCRPMRLGGVPIQGGPEVVAHSDGDVLLHALTDALLGCIGGGDIGELFPDTAAENENLSSAVFLNEVFERTVQANLTITHVDLTIIAQVPKLAPWKSHIAKNICRLLRLSPQQVNVKATTEEKLGFTGEKKGIKAVAAVTAIRPLES